jgi:hypothetical protein
MGLAFTKRECGPRQASFALLEKEKPFQEVDT